MESSIFTRKALLCILICYDNMNKLPGFSYGYISSVAVDYWGVYLNMFEDIIYPLGINIHDLLRVLEEGGPDALMNLEPSENFKPIKHERKLLLRVIQMLMHETTGSEKCRAQLSKTLGWDKTRVANDFRSKAKTISLRLVEIYCRAAGVKVSDVFKRYYDLYGDMPEMIKFLPCPSQMKE